MTLAAATDPTLNVTPVIWLVFLGAVLVFLALDLGVFHRQPRAVAFGEALMWTTIWFSMAMAFAFWLAPVMIGEQWQATHTKLFITGYVVELSLSMDNVFVIGNADAPAVSLPKGLGVKMSILDEREAVLKMKKNKTGSI